MRRLEVPIQHRTLWATGDIALWAELELLLKDTSAHWHRQTFLLDTGSELTTFPAFLAKQLGLPMPTRPAPGLTHRQTGLEIRSGVLRFQVSGMDPTEYGVACLFLGDPDTPPDPNQPATFPRNLLQPFHLLDQLRFILDRDAHVTAPYGTLTVEMKAP
jgi:hypothetical protein